MLETLTVVAALAILAGLRVARSRDRPGRGPRPTGPPGPGVRGPADRE